MHSIKSIRNPISHQLTCTLKIKSRRKQKLKTRKTQTEACSSLFSGLAYPRWIGQLHSATILVIRVFSRTSTKNLNRYLFWADAFLYNMHRWRRMVFHFMHISSLYLNSLLTPLHRRFCTKAAFYSSSCSKDYFSTKVIWSGCTCPLDGAVW